MADRILASPPGSKRGFARIRQTTAWTWTMWFLMRFGSPIALFGLWEWGARSGFLDARVLPAPTKVAVTIWDMIKNDVAILYPIPRIALFPLVLILVGLNETSNLVMIAIGPFFTMLITAMAAVMNVEPIYRDVARNFGVKPRHLYFTVTLPAVLPALMAGMLVSLGLALLGTVAVEFLVSTEGLGYIIWNSWQVLSLSRSMAGLVVGALLGAACYLMMDWLERWITPWQKPAKR
jgi:NitT/TauT family transport system permease protein